MATSCPVSFSTASLPADISILGTADSKSPHRRLQFRCLSMVYCSGIYLRSQLSCKSMSELLSICLVRRLIYSTTTVLAASTSQCISYVPIPRSCFLQMPHSAAKEAPSPPTSTFSIITLLFDPRDSSLKYSRWCNKLVSVLLWSKVRHFIIFYDHRSWLLLCNLAGEP